MKSFAALSAAAVLLLPLASTAGVADKQLENLLGTVTFTHGASTSPLAAKASIVLADKDFAQTGDKSRGAVTLPDSSVVTVGSNTKVQMAFFNQAEIATAKFIVYNGQTRFAVHHPQGAKSNYTFATPSASIAVRGTEGDIGVSADELQVNVYEVCDPELPVVVTTKGGQKFTVHAKEALVAQIVNGVVKAKVEELTAELMNRFTGDIGFPAIPSLDEFKGQVQGQAENAVDNATGNIGVSSAIGGLFKKKPQPTASPAPETTCS